MPARRFKSRHGAVTGPRPGPQAIIRGGGSRPFHLAAARSRCQRCRMARSRANFRSLRRSLPGSRLAWPPPRSPSRRPPLPPAVPPDRPLDSSLGDPTAVRAAVLIEAALAQVRPDDLRRCLDEFRRRRAAAVRAARAWRLADRDLRPAGRWRCLRPPQRGRTRAASRARRRLAGPDRLSRAAPLGEPADARCRLPVLRVRLRGWARRPIVTPTRWTPAAAVPPASGAWPPCVALP